MGSVSSSGSNRSASSNSVGRSPSSPSSRGASAAPSSKSAASGVSSKQTGHASRPSANKTQKSSKQASPPVSGARVAPVAAAAPKAGTTPGTLKAGARGAQVKALQTVLQGQGLYKGRVDGVFGPQTLAAVKSFQQARGLKADGVVGPQTYGKLGAGLSMALSVADKTPAQLKQLAAQPNQLGAFLRAALAQRGDRYVYGAEADPRNPNPNRFDCSELVQWAAARAGINMPESAMLQLDRVRQAHTQMSVEKALRTPGALLFREGSQPHVAISLGDGRTMEARGKKDGVDVFDNAGGRHWTAAGLLPGR